MFIRKFVIGVATTAILATLGVFSLPTTGWAQLEEMIVTARKREESMQDIPIAVTAFSVQDIARKGIDSLENVGLLSSSLQYDEAVSPDATKIVIRGLSNSRGRSNAAILVDGIDTTTESIAQNGGGATFNLRMADLERIEVVKGPQSALFGRSAFNGAIQFVTRNPSDEFSAEMEVEGGNFDRYSTKATVSGPITDGLGFRLSGSWWDEEGFYRNLRNDQKVGGTDGWNVAGTLRWEPTSDLWLKLRVEYQEQSNEQNPAVIVPANVITATPEGACIDQGGGAGSVFECDGIGLFASNTAARDAIEAALNPNGVAPVPGPVVAGVNECSGPYKGSVTSEGFFCQFRGAIPDMSDLPGIYLNPDPRTGKNFRGLEAETLRISLLGEWDVGLGVIKSWTGYYDGETHSIQDWQAAGDLDFCGTFVDPTAPGAQDNFVAIDPGPDVSCVLSYNNNQHFIDQWSQELQFQSDWDHWQQLTVGGVRWYEDRDFFDFGGTVRSRSIECVVLDDDTVPQSTSQPCGVFSVPITGEIFQDILDLREIAQFGLIDGQNSSRETFHWSAYFQGDTDLNGLANDLFGQDFFLPGKWSLITEARWNHETTKISGLDSSSSGSTGAGICGDGPIQGSWTTTDPAPANPSHACSGVVQSFPLSPGGPFSPPFPASTTGGPPLLPPVTTPFNNVDVDTFGTPLCAFTDEEIAEFDNEELGVLSINCDGDPQTPIKTGETTSNWWTGKVTLQWEPTDDMLWYFSHAWASKPGGFATVQFGSSGFAPTQDVFVAEKMRVYELGVKSTWFGNTLQINGSGFFQDFSDKQVSTQRAVVNPFEPDDIGTSPIVVNASSARVWGGELDVLWAPDVDVFGGDVLFGGSYTYLDAVYTDFTQINFSGTDIHTTLSCEPIIDEDTGFAACITDLSGNRMEDAPKHAANISAAWVRPLFDDWNIFLEQDTQYVGKRFIEDVNASYVDKWWNTDLRLGIENDQFELLFFVNNLFDGDGIQRANTTPGLSCCFTFAHFTVADTPAAGLFGPSGTARGGPVFNSGVVIATLRPPRHWGFRATAKF